MLALFFAGSLTLLAAVSSGTTIGLPDLGVHPLVMTAEDTAAADRAKDLITQIQTGKIDRSQLTPAFSEVFTAGAVATDAAYLAGRGKPASFALVQRSDVTTDTSSDVRYVFIASFEDGSLSYTFGVDKATGLIDALYFRPFRTS